MALAAFSGGAICSKENILFCQSRYCLHQFVSFQADLADLSFILWLLLWWLPVDLLSHDIGSLKRRPWRQLCVFHVLKGLVDLFNIEETTQNSTCKPQVEGVNSLSKFVPAPTSLPRTVHKAMHASSDQRPRTRPSTSCNECRRRKQRVSSYT
jgi:hypothetical protein